MNLTNVCVNIVQSFQVHVHMYIIRLRKAYIIKNLVFSNPKSSHSPNYLISMRIYNCVFLLTYTDINMSIHCAFCFISTSATIRIYIYIYAHVHDSIGNNASPVKKSVHNHLDLLTIPESLTLDLSLSAMQIS